MKCKLCSAILDVFGKILVLQRYMVTYSRCPICGFIQAEPPYWLEESYVEPVTDSDVGMVQRNYQLASVVKVVIDVFCKSDGKFIDYGGGYGLLTRLMRDKGYDFYSYDTHCLPIFARNFTVAPGDGGIYEMATAFEVAEHFVDPLYEFERLLALAPNILFTTELVPTHLTRPDDWWYIAPEHGQHVAFYTSAALAGIARRFNRYFITNGNNIHLFSTRKVSSLLFNVLTKHPVVSVLNLMRSRPSLIEHDFAVAQRTEVSKGE